MLAQESGGKALEVLRPDEFCHRGKCCFKRLAKRNSHVVAVDIEAAARVATLAIAKAFGALGLGVKKRPPERGLINGHAGAFARMTWARWASASSVGQSGTSLSHSIKVGRAPPLAIT